MILFSLKVFKKIYENYLFGINCYYCRRTNIVNKSTTLFSSAGRCIFDAEKMITLRRQSFYSAGLILFGISEVCCKDLSVSFRMGMYKKTITIKIILSLQESDHELQKYVNKLGKTKGRILDTTLFFWMSRLLKQCCFLFCRKYYYIRCLHFFFFFVFLNFINFFILSFNSILSIVSVERRQVNIIF